MSIHCRGCLVDKYSTHTNSLRLVISERLKPKFVHINPLWVYELMKLLQLALSLCLEMGGQGEGCSCLWCTCVGDFDRSESQGVGCKRTTTNDLDFNAGDLFADAFLKCCLCDFFESSNHLCCSLD